MRRSVRRRELSAGIVMRCKRLISIRKSSATDATQKQTSLGLKVNRDESPVQRLSPVLLSGSWPAGPPHFIFVGGLRSVRVSIDIPLSGRLWGKGSVLPLDTMHDEVHFLCLGRANGVDRLKQQGSIGFSLGNIDQFSELCKRRLRRT